MANPLWSLSQGLLLKFGKEFTLYQSFFLFQQIYVLQHSNVFSTKLSCYRKQIFQKKDNPSTRKSYQRNWKYSAGSYIVFRKTKWPKLTRSKKLQMN